MEKLKKKTRLKLKKKVIIIGILTIIFSISVYKLASFYYDSHNNKVENKNILDNITKVKTIINDKGEKEEIFSVDFEELKKTNPDIKGWIRMDNNNISYPIVQSTDNSYYLNHSINKKKNSLGTIFMDYRNTSWNDKNVVIFGHNGSDKSMFGRLRYIFDKDYFNEPNKNIIEIIDTTNNIYYYEIFSYYAIESEEYYITTNFNSDNEYLDFLNNIKARSYKNFQVNLSSTDKIITLSTCNGSGATTKRTVIHARLIER